MDRMPAGPLQRLLPDRMGLSHLTWNHAGDGLVSLWSLSDSGMFTFANFGPYTDWAAGALTVSADDTLHVGWSEPGGTASLWDVSAANPLSFTDALLRPLWKLAASIPVRNSLAAPYEG